VPFVASGPIIRAMIAERRAMTAPFDFDAAVTAPFRMQPGLRRLAPGTPQFTPLDPASPAFAAKLEVLRTEPQEALLADAGFDDGPACRALAAELAREHPADFALDGDVLVARRLGARLDLRHGDVAMGEAPRSRPDTRPAAVPSRGAVAAAAESEIDPPSALAGLLPALAPPQRRQAFLALALHEDLAVLDAATTRLRWLVVCLPSHWTPRDKIGRPFAEVHAPVADNALLLGAGAHLARLVSQPARWERFVWNLTPHAGWDQHPRRHPRPPWPLERGPEAVGAAAWLRSERQSFVPLPDERQAVFTIHVGLQRLAEVALDAARAARLRDALASMSKAVLAYRGLAEAREPLLRWLAGRTGPPGAASPEHADARRREGAAGPA
jgi:hypothetical protein